MSNSARAYEAWAWMERGIEPPEKLALLWICRWVETYAPSMEVEARLGELAEFMGVERAAANVAINHLLTMGLLTVNRGFVRPTGD